MRISPLLTRRAVLSSSMILSNLLPAMHLRNVPAWLTPTEQTWVESMINDSEGISLADLQRTSYRRIRDAIGDSCQVVLIGEATHGTEEFYRIRAELTKCLLQRDGFDAVLCEGDFPPFFALNRFVGGAPSGRNIMDPSHRKKTKFTHGETGRGERERSDAITSDLTTASVDQVLQDGFSGQFPEWMWLNNAMNDFVTWLRSFNASRDKKLVPIQLLGLDIYSMFRSIDEVIDYLNRTGEMRLAKLARDCYSTLNNFRPEPKAYGRATFHNVVQSQADNVARVLASLLKEKNRLLRDPADGAELFNAIENARVVAASEKYFRQLYVPGENTTWNLRDSAFLDAIKNAISYITRRKAELGRQYEKTRVIVWAHNSHVGDASATANKHRGQYNVGQLCREAFGKDNVYIVGFSANQGTVRASHQWGGSHQVFRLTPAFEGSHEYLLHTVAKNRRQNAFGYTLRSNSLVSGNSQHVDAAARELFSANRLERFVGVNYLPKTELRSHYSTCNMSDQFDFIMHLDRSTALRVNKVLKKTHRTLSEVDTGTMNSAKSDMILLDKYGENYKVLSEKHV